MPHNLNNSLGKVVIISQPPAPRSNRSCLLDNISGNGNCHNNGLVNFPTTLPCNRCNVPPLYVQEICHNRAHGCAVSYSKCVKELTCNHSNCNVCS